MLTNGIITGPHPGGLPGALGKGASLLFFFLDWSPLEGWEHASLRTAVSDLLVSAAQHTPPGDRWLWGSSRWDPS